MSPGWAFIISIVLAFFALMLFTYIGLRNSVTQRDASIMGWAAATIVFVLMLMYFGVLPK